MALLTWFGRTIKTSTVGLRRTAYLEMTPLMRIKATNTTIPSTELLEGFRY